MRHLHNPFRVALIAYAITYGSFAIFFYYELATRQRPEDHPKFPPSSAFIWEPLYATALFAAIAAIWLVGAMIWAAVSAVIRLVKHRKIT